MSQSDTHTLAARRQVPGEPFRGFRNRTGPPRARRNAGTGSTPAARDTIRRGWRTLFWLPLLGLLAATAILHVTDADVAICRLFYDPATRGWTYADALIWRKLYDWGPLPGLVLGVLGLAVWVISWFQRRIRRLGDAGFFFAALLALGPGLVINGVFKPGLCRPRPHQVTDFGGPQAFVAAWGMGLSPEGKSFPSGHASMGFYLMAPAFLLYRRHRRLACGFLIVGLVSGGAIGLARIAEGDHFPSDVLWSAGLVYLSGLVLAYAVHTCRRRLSGAVRTSAEIEPGRVLVSPAVLPSKADVVVPVPPARRDAA